jgi:hypothetical protein
MRWGEWLKSLGVGKWLSGRIQMGVKGGIRGDRGVQLFQRRRLGRESSECLETRVFDQWIAISNEIWGQGMRFT